MATLHTRSIAFLLLALAFDRPLPAAAQSQPPSGESEAERLAGEGYSLLFKRKPNESLARFEAARRLIGKAEYTAKIIECLDLMSASKKLVDENNEAETQNLLIRLIEEYEKRYQWAPDRGDDTDPLVEATTRAWRGARLRLTRIRMDAGWRSLSTTAAKTEPDYAGAIRHFTDALPLDAPVEARKGLALANFQNGDYNAALKWLDELKQRQEDNPVDRDWLNWLLFRTRLAKYGRFRYGVLATGGPVSAQVTMPSAYQKVAGLDDIRGSLLLAQVQLIPRIGFVVSEWFAFYLEPTFSGSFGAKVSPDAIGQVGSYPFALLGASGALTVEASVPIRNSRHRFAVAIGWFVGGYWSNLPRRICPELQDPVCDLISEASSVGHGPLLRLGFNWHVRSPSVRRAFVPWGVEARVLVPELPGFDVFRFTPGDFRLEWPPRNDLIAPAPGRDLIDSDVARCTLQEESAEGRCRVRLGPAVFLSIFIGFEAG